uniref:CAMPATH-1 antigen n=1 Tax=Sciurus vulgaris TaxID=55149 RepID=A0A8D2AJS9_SCIVU
MNGFLFLLLTFSFLALTQIQTGVLGQETYQGGAPALSNMDGGSVLFFLTNTLIHLFYLS